MLLAMAITISVAVIPVQTEAAVESPFKDVSENSPYYEIVHEMRDRNIISGYENGEFRPTEVITRKHAAALVNRATKLKATKPFVPFKDVSTKNTFFNDVKKLQQAGIFEPDAKGNLYPNQPITRAEMAKMLSIAYDLEVKVELDFMDVKKATRLASTSVRFIRMASQREILGSTIPISPLQECIMPYFCIDCYI